MKRRFITLAIVAFTLSIVAPFTTCAQQEVQPYIDMSTTIEREVTPDELYLKIVICESDYKGKKNLEEMQEAMLGALKENRIDIPECLTMNYMGSDISYTAFSKKIKPKTEATYMLKLRDAATMQQVIASLEKRQISNIELAQVKFTKEKELKNEMAVEAMQQAQAEARVLAGAIGQEIGKAICINSFLNSGQAQPRLYKSRANSTFHTVMVKDEASPAPIISIGKITYNFNVSVRFELK